MNTLIIVGMNQKVMNDYECTDYVINLLKILREYFLCAPQVFCNDWKQLLANVVFPLMKPFEDEIVSFNESPI